MFQIVFTDSAAAELSKLPKLLQMEILSKFNGLSDEVLKNDPDRFGCLERDGRKLLRYRAVDYRIYFERTDDGILIHRVLHKNSLKDFFYRSSLPLAEDEELQKNPAFWDLIDQRDKP
jgi:mRNA-degrading endonuclease RelE of RelBE toxin-antitoxin system